MSVLRRLNAHVSGSGSRAMVFAHGYGCDQNMWRFVVPAFRDEYRIVTFDLMGAGGSDLSAYQPEKYASLNGFSDDLIALCQELDVEGGVLVGHSVSAMIGVLAANREPDLFDDLILVGPSPRYINDQSYLGGFAETEIAELLEFLDSNHMGWAGSMAPLIMGNTDRPELAGELTNSFCRTDPAILKHFARTTFLSDNRADLRKVQARCLVLQCSEDVIAPLAVGQYVHDAIPGSKLVILRATGHCPNLSAPDETIAAMKAFLPELAS
ncbi:alpha/beta hydrolase [Pseudoroseomonas deserti]|uniref:Alpha/beta hydrolase n=1 Tax=Teichococcus deserti TaxID=1817963 RepID=A0A1V2H6L1_9PROT|nr:alpha/beta hydrolase [Pseudoroseomonas deserti]ONG57892.1 alpha/beta hydrolase [Pseudoroseomonas deserti]